MEGDDASLFALDMHVAGLINFVFSENGPNEAINIEGDFVLDESVAKLSIDASDFTFDGSSDDKVLQLIRYSSHTGTFASKNVMVIGLDPTLLAELVNGPDSLDLIITHNPTYRVPEVQQHHKQHQNGKPHTMFKETSHQETNQRYHLLHHHDDGTVH